MSNSNLTPLIPPMYRALEIVSREQVGLIPSVGRNSNAERVALGQLVTIPIAGVAALADNTPGVTAPNTGDQTASKVDMTITASKHYPIRWNGEETMGMESNGTFESFVQQEFVNAFRQLSNAIEAELALAAANAASRAYGTAGTAPFGTAGNLADFAQILKMLKDNGAPTADLHMVLDTAAAANLRGVQSVLFKVNEAGTAELLRQGVIGRVQAFDLHESAGFVGHTKGTGAATYAVNLLAGYPVGTTTIALDTGNGTVLAGDVVTFAGDTNKYVVTTGIAAAGDLTIAAPGLRQTLADGVFMTVGNNFSPNIAFDRNAIQLATRFPARPKGGDMADDVTSVKDPVSGLEFEVAIYRQYRQIHIEVAIAWGTKVIKPAHTMLLLG